MGMTILTEILFFSVKEERRTRGHGVTLAKKQDILYIRNISFLQRTVNKWNILSADLWVLVVLIYLKIKSTYT